MFKFTIFGSLCNVFRNFLLPESTGGGGVVVVKVSVSVVSCAGQYWFIAVLLREISLSESNLVPSALITV